MIALVVVAVLSVGFMLGIVWFRWHHVSLRDDLKEELEAVKRRSFEMSGVSHDLRLRVERQTLHERPWASGRAWRDDDGTTHSMPAGFFALTICEREVPCRWPHAPAVKDRYPYVIGVGVVDCIECLAKEGADDE